MKVELVEASSLTVAPDEVLIIATDIAFEMIETLSDELVKLIGEGRFLIVGTDGQKFDMVKVKA